MGGERETTVEKKEPKSKSEKATIGNYRIHESKGEIHVHDDTNKLKSAVPVAVWWKMWDKLRNEPGSWVWIDPAHKSRLNIQTVVDQTGVDVIINLAATTFGDTWDKLNTFTKKK